MTAKPRSTAGVIAAIVARTCAVALILCFLVALYFTARGFNVYREALEQMSLDDMAARIEQQAGFTSVDELPDLYLHATVAVEDHRFYAHPGFDAIATMRALVNNLRAGAIVEGGSTITQQLAKNQYFTQEQTIERKVAEVFMALTMEQHFSKRTILELYVNSIYFGDGHTGIGPASEGYFGKRPADLTADECTLLAGIPNAPSAYALRALRARPQTAGARAGEACRLRLSGARRRAPHRRTSCRERAPCLAKRVRRRAQHAIGTPPCWTTERPKGPRHADLGGFSPAQHEASDPDGPSSPKMPEDSDFASCQTSDCAKFFVW